eukprot:SAG31_NODE_1295_length_8952_cov_8.332957_9_plen_90_part_00
MSILAYAVALARQEGASDFVNALLDRGADPNLQTGTTTPFLEACSHNHLILVRNYRPVSFKESLSCAKLALLVGCKDVEHAKWFETAGW